jgi:predicted PurR-regulated permease PerM
METDIKFWAVCGVLAAVMPLVAWLLALVFKWIVHSFGETRKQNTQITQSINDLAASISNLALAVKDWKIWAMEKFVDKDDHKEDINRLESTIRKYHGRRSGDVQ